jgi:uncharacterized protein (DUF4415 family)
VFLEANRKRLGRPKKAIVKQQVTLRLDPEVIAYFKTQGAGWQSRMNDALKGMIQAHE